MDNMDEFIYSYIYALSVFYCDKLEEMKNMEKLDIDNVESSIWALALITFILTNCCCCEVKDKEEDE